MPMSHQGMPMSHEGMEGMDHAMVAPLLPLPAVGIADRIFDAGEKVVAEPND